MLTAGQWVVVVIGLVIALAQLACCGLVPFALLAVPLCALAAVFYWRQRGYRQSR